MVALMLACVLGLDACSQRGKNAGTVSSSTQKAPESGTGGPAPGFSGEWLEKDGENILWKCEYAGGKKHGTQTRYYHTEGRNTDVMAIQHFENGVKQGISERYEMMTHVLLSRCEYRDGAIWSGAALDSGGEIEPEDVMVQDLPYHVVIYKDGKMDRRELSTPETVGSP